MRGFTVWVVKGTGAWGGASAEGVGAAAGAAGDVQRELDKIDFEGWADDAIDAAEAVTEAINEVSLGASPGGIKEIPITLVDATAEFQRFEAMTLARVARINEAVGRMNQVTQQTGGGAASQSMGSATFVGASPQLVSTPQGGALLLPGAPAPTPGEQPTAPMFRESAAPVINLTINTLTADEAGVRKVIEEDLMPEILRQWRENTNESRTDTREAIGLGEEGTDG